MVPCSTSNLGAGFDCVGLAFDRYLNVTFEESDELSVERHGTLADVEGEDIIAAILADNGIKGIIIEDSTIPIGKGLGSSAAATIAALAIMSATRGDPFDYNDVLQAATSLEGHPDNAAPCILGGLVGVVSDGTRLRALPLHLSEEIGFVFAAPQAIVSTKAARQSLPEQIPHISAARTIKRTVALMEGLAEADPELLRIACMDELHVPYRIVMIPGGSNALEAAVEAGAWAATISGSGSGLVALCERGKEEAVRDAMAHVFEHATRQSAIAFVAKPDFAGVQISKVP
jgi:homoserine kinase